MRTLIFSCTGVNAFTSYIAQESNGIALKQNSSKSKNEREYLILFEARITGISELYKKEQRLKVNLFLK